MFDCLNVPPVLSSNIRLAFVAYLKQAISYQKLESRFSKEQYEKCYLLGRYTDALLAAN